MVVCCVIRQCEVICSLWTEGNHCRRLLSLVQQVYCRICVIGDFHLCISKMYCCILFDFQCSILFYQLVRVSTGVAEKLRHSYGFKSGNSLFVYMQG